MTVTLGGIAALIAALAFLYLVVRLGGLLGKAGQILDETTVSLRTTSDNVQPTLKGLTDTVSLTNDQLTRVDSITSSVTTMTTNASALTSLTAATIGTPLIKVAAFSYGVRTAVRGLSRKDDVVRGRTVLLAAVAVGVGYGLWRLPVTQRFVTTFKDASARREAELREAVEVAVETDAHQPRPAARRVGTDPRPRGGCRLGPQRRARRREPGIRAGRRRPGSLPDARGGAGAAARPHRRASSVGAGAPPPTLPFPPDPDRPPARTGIRCRVPVPGGRPNTRGLIPHGNR